MQIQFFFSRREWHHQHCKTPAESAIRAKSWFEWIDSSPYQFRSAGRSDRGRAIQIHGDEQKDGDLKFEEPEKSTASLATQIAPSPQGKKDDK